MMWRRIVRWLAPLLIAGVCFLPSAHAQFARRAPAPEENTSRGGALPWAVAFLSLILILVIVCKPSRKAEIKR